MDIKAAIFGNLTIDHNITETGKFVGPGGSAYFIAKQLENLNFRPTIISSYGPDFPKRYLTKTTFLPAEPNMEKTLIFRNITKKVGLRQQWVENYKNLPPLTGFKQEKILPKKIKLIFVAPILPNISAAEINHICRYFADSLKILLPQGFFRKIAANGKIEPGREVGLDKIITLFEVVIVSDKDYNGIEKIAQNWSKKTKIIIVTKEDNGCDVYQAGKRINIAAFPAQKIVDSTGAGDIFAAAFGFALLKDKQIEKAAVLANRIACLSLRYLPNQLQYSQDEYHY